jgi:hypothetical protein
MIAHNFLKNQFSPEFLRQPDYRMSGILLILVQENPGRRYPLMTSKEYMMLFMHQKGAHYSNGPLNQPGFGVRVLPGKEVVAGRDAGKESAGKRFCRVRFTHH